MAHLLPLRGKKPEVAPDAFIAPTAVLIGDVRIEAGASVWFGAVIRGDDPIHPIVVGPGANVQDGAIIHVGRWGPTLIGPKVTVGHGAVMESCRIGEGTLIGMNAIVLPKAEIGQECLVAAGAVVLEDSEIPDRSLVAGVPGRVRRKFEETLPPWLARSSEHYSELSHLYREEALGEAGSSGPGASFWRGGGGEAEPGDHGLPARPGARARRDVVTCSLCGSPVLERHCKLICVRCGYERDCSDP